MNKGLSINGLYDGNYVEKNIDILDQPSKYLFTEITKPYVKGDIDSAFIRPDIYKMIYSFEDDNTHEKVETARYVIVLQPRGDANFSGSINLQDVNPMYQYFNNANTYFKTEGTDHVITGTARLVYIYRCLDLKPTNSINLQDTNPVYQYTSKYKGLSSTDKANSNNPLEEWYVELPDSI